MTLRVVQTATVWEGADGQRIQYGIHGATGDESANRDRLWGLKDPAKKIYSLLVLEDGAEVHLPFTELPWILPDASGVVVIFKKGSYVKSDGSDVFAYPNNAAVFNADGSLRFQVKVQDSRVHHIGCMHGGEMPAAYKGMVGLLVAFDTEHPPESLFALDSNRPELIGSLLRVPY